MTELDIVLPLWELHSSNWPQGGPLCPGLAAVAWVKPNTDTGMPDSCSALPCGAVQQLTTSANFCCSPKALVQQQTHTSSLSSLSFLINSCLAQKKVSFFLDKYQLSESSESLIWTGSHCDRRLLQIRWGQLETTTNVKPSTAHWLPWWMIHCWPRESHHLYQWF